MIPQSTPQYAQTIQVTPFQGLVLTIATTARTDIIAGRKCFIVGADQFRAAAEHKDRPYDPQESGGWAFLQLSRISGIASGEYYLACSLEDMYRRGPLDHLWEAGRSGCQEFNPIHFH